MKQWKNTLKENRLPLSGQNMKVKRSENALV